MSDRAETWAVSVLERETASFSGVYGMGSGTG